MNVFWILDFRFWILDWSDSIRIQQPKKPRRSKPLRLFRLLDPVQVNNPQSKIQNPKSKILLVLVLLAGCADPRLPTGGPPDKTPPAKSTKKPPRPAKSMDPPPDKYQAVLHKQCTPESTLGYCEGSTNLIHLDPDYAKSFGFRAPIIAGNQTVNFLPEGLALDGIPAAPRVMQVLRLKSPKSTASWHG